MDELNITPQPTGDQPDGEGNPNQPETPEATNGNEGSFSLEGEQKAETKPNIESELLQPNQGEEPAAVEQPAVEPVTPTPEAPPAMEEQSNPAQLEEEVPVEEPATTDSVLTTNETPKKGGIPKWAMIAAGVVGLGAIVVGAMFATNTWPLQGQLSPDILEDDLKLVASEYCPDGQYYDAGETAVPQNRLELLDQPTENTGGQQNLRLLNAVPTAKAQRFEAAAPLEAAPLEAEYIEGLDIAPTLEAEYSEGLDIAPLEADYSTNFESEPPPEANYTAEYKEGRSAEYVDESLKAAESLNEGLTLEEQAGLKAGNEELTLERQADFEAENEGLTLEKQADLESGSEGLTFEKQADLESGSEGLTFERQADFRAESETAVLERAPLEVDTATFDRTKCKTIPPTNCDLINKLLESPEAYFISPATLKNLSEWKLQNCQEKTIEVRTPTVIPEVVVKTCGENQELEASSNECACRPGYFELESASSYAEKTDTARLSTIDATTRDNILEEATGLALTTNEKSPQNTLKLLDDSTENTGLPINNNISGGGSEERTGLEINNNSIREDADLTSLTGLRTNRVAQLVCINCEELKDRIGVLKTRLGGLDDLDITADQRATQESVLLAEVTRLEAKSKEENCGEERTPLIPLIPEVTTETGTCDELVEQIVKIQGYPTAATTPEIAQELAVLVAQAEEQGCEIPEKNVCAEYAEESSNRISLGDFTGSFNQQIAYLDASCVRSLDPCDAKLAYATVAKEYRSLASETDDANFFEQEYLTRRDDYMNDLACVPDKPGRCTEIEGRLAEGYIFSEGGTLTRADVADNSILTLDEINPATRESNLLSQTNLDQRITENLESRRVLNDKEYQDLYCQPFSTPRIGDITPITPIESPVVPPEAPEQPVEQPVNPPVDPIVEPPVSPPTPEEELAASAPDNDFLAPAAPSPDTVDTGEASITPPLTPPLDTTELAEIAESGFAAPAQPGEPVVLADGTILNPAAPAPDAVTEMPEITEAPLITKTGPEAFIFFFAFIASQMYYFRRQIYAFVESR